MRRRVHGVGGLVADGGGDIQWKYATGMGSQSGGSSFFSAHFSATHPCTDGLEVTAAAATAGNDGETRTVEIGLRRRVVDCRDDDGGVSDYRRRKEQQQRR
ncbi:UNVERIFIED_CONTAM: hypothetical protein Sindi_2491000 [Sesamum indicum]